MNPAQLASGDFESLLCSHHNSRWHAPVGLAIHDPKAFRPDSYYMRFRDGKACEILRFRGLRPDGKAADFIDCRTGKESDCFMSDLGVVAYETGHMKERAFIAPAAEAMLSLGKVYGLSCYSINTKDYQPDDNEALFGFIHSVKEENKLHPGERYLRYSHFGAKRGEWLTFCRPADMEGFGVFEDEAGERKQIALSDLGIFKGEKQDWMEANFIVPEFHLMVLERDSFFSPCKFRFPTKAEADLNVTSGIGRVPGQKDLVMDSPYVVFENEGTTSLIGPFKNDSKAATACCLIRFAYPGATPETRNGCDAPVEHVQKLLSVEEFLGSLTVGENEKEHELFRHYAEAVKLLGNQQEDESLRKRYDPDSVYIVADHIHGSYNDTVFGKRVFGPFGSWKLAREMYHLIKSEHPGRFPYPEDGFYWDVSMAAGSREVRLPRLLDSEHIIPASEFLQEFCREGIGFNARYVVTSMQELR